MISIKVDKKKNMGQTPNGQSITRKESALDVKYYEIYKRDKNPAWLRAKLVKHAKKFSIKDAAREFGCSKNTVKLWLNDKSDTYNNRPRSNNSYKRIPDETENYILSCREKEFMGKTNLQKQYNIPVSPSTVYRVLKRNNKIKTRKKKWQKKMKHK